METSGHWDKVTQLIERLRQDEEARRIFQQGTATEKVKLLREYRIELEDIGYTLDDVSLMSGEVEASAWWWW